MRVECIKCKIDVWCGFEALQLEKVEGHEGIYVIWYETPGEDVPIPVRVGQGDIAPEG